MASRKNKHMRIHPSFPQPGQDQPSHLGSQSAAPMPQAMPQAPGAEVMGPGQPPDPSNVLGSSGY